MTGRAGIACVILLTLTWLLLGPASLHPAPPPGQLCLQHLDVGQGDSLLLSMPAGERILIDGGGIPGSRFDVGLRRVIPALRRAGVHRLDTVVVTHGDADHAQGVFAVLEELDVGLLLVGSRTEMRGPLRSLVALAERSGVPVHALDSGPPPRMAGAPGRIDWLHPLGPTASWAENDRSVVFSASMGAVGVLLTGDIEAHAESHLLARGAVPRTAVLKVAHHGSRTSSSARFLEAVNPLVGLAGAGDGNRFGFPHASTSARLLRRGAPLYWTGRHGSIRACTDGWSLRVEGLDPRGKTRLLREWSAEEVARWSALPPPTALHGAGLLRPIAETGDTTDDVSARPAPKRRSSRKRERRAPRPRKKKVKAEQTPPPEEDEPPLLDDRTWEKHRKRRGKLRAPWK